MSNSKNSEGKMYPPKKGWGRFNLQDAMTQMAFMTRALHSRNYRLFFVGQIISLLGNWVTQVSIIWLAWELTHSAFKLGTLGFASQMPAFLLGPIAGVIVDRMSRHRILLMTQSCAMIESFVLAILTLTGNITYPLIMVLMGFQGIVNAFDMPARQAFVVEMVEHPDDLSNAIALNSSLFNSARILGASIGGIILGLFGAGICFLLDGFSYTAVIVCLILMHVPKFKKPRNKDPWKQLREGFFYIKNSPPISAVLKQVAGISLVGMSFSTLLPVVAARVLEGEAGTYATLAAVQGLGALAGAIMLASMKSVKGLTRVVLFCTCAFGIGLAVFSYSKIMIISIIAVVVVGFCWTTQNASCNTIVQTVVDPDKRGRVMSFYVMAFVGTMPFGSLVGGTIADRFGASNTLLICGILCVFLSYLFYRRLPTINKYVNPVVDRMERENILPADAAGAKEA